MKNSRIVIFFLLTIHAFGQETDISNLIVSNNLMINVNFMVYENPLKIKQVNSKSQINYANSAGLLQSFYSANTKEWADSDYLIKPATLVRDQEHFDAVKKRNVVKNYIQLESVYNFEYNNRQFAFLKYAITDEHLPFALLGILSTEKVNNRWYISQMLNQNQVTTILVNFDNSVLKSLFTNTHNPNIDLNVEKSMQMKTGTFSFAKTDRLFDDLINQGNKAVLRTLKDKRNVDATFKAPIAIENSKATLYKVELPHPFLMDSTRYLEYGETDSVVLSNTENMKLWQDKSESILANEASSIKLDSKFGFYWQSKEYIIITYFSPIKNTIVIVKENGSFRKETVEFQNFKSLFLRIKKGILLAFKVLMSVR